MGDGTHSDSKKYFDKAVRLYELAYESYLEYDKQQQHQRQRRRRRLRPDQDSFGLLRLTMILWNNLGQIHRSAADWTKHELCLHRLLRLLMYAVVECGRGSSLAETVFTPTELNGFYHNVSSIVLDDAACASAA